GTAGPDSDVDLLVVDSFSGKGWRRAVEILGRVQPNFPIDLLVRKPEEIEWRVQAGDPFINDIVNEGVILHAADHSGMD
nr:nucleotidyltransferase domain-containing protein [Pirellulales bacterium]